jgi:hypothetical protein
MTETGAIKHYLDDFECGYTCIEAAQLDLHACQGLCVSDCN